MRHRRIDPANWERIFVVGDVHGCRRELESLLAEIDPSPDDLVVFVGDLVRKGPDSAGVVRLVRRHDNLLSVKGNNEPKIVSGAETIPDLTTDDIAFLDSLPTLVSWPGNLVVHGGVDPRRDLASHTAEELRNLRNPRADGDYARPFWWDRHDAPPRVFFGHTPLADPIASPTAVGLDTSCVYGGSLTAFDTSRNRFVSVPAEETYQERSADRIVTPRPQNRPMKTDD